MSVTWRIVAKELSARPTKGMARQPSVSYRRWPKCRPDSTRQGASVHCGAGAPNLTRGNGNTRERVEQ
ncbi:hypothetical protein SEA_HUGHESYANG_222 [Mycobacterium phage Hughesyang]|nr:hypothetical protein SEA_HUGHESYANG_222 [Mycobacterium phage Hughesyang]